MKILWMRKVENMINKNSFKLFSKTFMYIAISIGITELLTSGKGILGIICFIATIVDLYDEYWLFK